jgi:hypothetical protein
VIINILSDLLILQMHNCIGQRIAQYIHILVMANCLGNREDTSVALWSPKINPPLVTVHHQLYLSMPVVQDEVERLRNEKEKKEAELARLKDEHDKLEAEKAQWKRFNDRLQAHVQKWENQLGMENSSKKN